MGKIERFEDGNLAIGQRMSSDVWSIILNTSFNGDYKLHQKINGASGSIMDNIAEGFERDGNREFVNFLSIAKTSCDETRS